MTPLQFGIQPFWFWNGEMREDEIVRQIEAMHAQGLRGFLIHPRQGMEIPYLSRTFFDRVRTAVEAAAARGMEVWLYDEFPYPSGVSGGEVLLAEADYRCRQLERAWLEAEGGAEVELDAPWGRLLTARAYAIVDGAVQWSDWIDLSADVGVRYREDIFQFSGLTRYNRKRYFQGDPVQSLRTRRPRADAGASSSMSRPFDHFKYFEFFIDPLNPAPSSTSSRPPTRATPRRSANTSGGRCAASSRTRPSPSRRAAPGRRSCRAHAPRDGDRVWTTCPCSSMSTWAGGALRSATTTAM